jgi:hypothetical protein
VNCASNFIALVVATFLTTFEQAFAQQNNSAHVAEIAQKGRELFGSTRNHCHAFRDLVHFACGKVNGPIPLLEDLKLILVGTSLRERGHGPHYIGGTPGARGDTGFKDALRDGSPQVEHALAAIYIGKVFPPGTAEAVSLRTELMGPLTGDGKLNTADILLYALGADIGQRLSASNFRELSKVIERTMCK